MSGKNVRKRIAIATMMAFSVESEKRDSQYFRQLDNKAKARYKEKLQILGGIEDPYVEGSSVAPESAIDWQDWSNVEYTDIYNYLIATPSPYTKEQLRAYKSMDRYVFVANGWADVPVYPIPSCSSNIFSACSRSAFSKVVGDSSKTLGCS